MRASKFKFKLLVNLTSIDINIKLINIFHLWFCSWYFSENCFENILLLMQNGVLTKLISFVLSEWLGGVIKLWCSFDLSLNWFMTLLKDFSGKTVAKWMLLLVWISAVTLLEMRESLFKWAKAYFLSFREFLRTNALENLFR